MHLLVGIDTEGDNQWDAAARANQTFENIYALPRLHALFARHGVRPTYVITHPVATDPRSADVLRAAARRRRLRNRRAPSRLGNAAVHARRRRGGIRMRRRCRARSSRRSSPALTEAIAAAVGVRAGVVPVGPLRVLGRSRRRARAAGYLVESSVAPLFYEAHKGGPEFVEAPLTPVLPRLRQRDAGRDQQPARGAGLRRAEPAAAEAPAVRLRACAAAVHDQAGAARARARAHALAAAVVLVARRHDGARPRPGARAASRCSTCSSTRAKRSSAAARTTGRRASSTPSATGSSGSWPFATKELGAHAGDVRGVPRRYCADQLTAGSPRRDRSRDPSGTLDADRSSTMHILHVTPHLPPDQAANALLPWQLGLRGRVEAGDTVEYVAHPPRAGGPAALARAGDVDPARAAAAWSRGRCDVGCDRARGCIMRTAC